MTKAVLARIKRIQALLFLIVILLLILGGCGDKEAENGGMADLGNMAVSLSEGADTSTMGAEERAGANDIQEAEQWTRPDMEMNPEKTVVIYRGIPFMSSNRAIGGDSIYITGFQGEFTGDQPAEGPYFAGRIGIGEDTVQEFDLEIPDDMFVYRSCTDERGRWHLLLSQRIDNRVTYERSEIWIVSSQGELEGSFDVTESIREWNSIPFWMAVDHQGNYYFLSSFGNGGSLLMIDIENLSATPLRFGEGSIDGIGVGRSGTVYGVFTQTRDISYLGSIDPYSGSVERCADFPENSSRPGFTVLQGGVNTELLLANTGEGVWSYDGEELELVVPLKELAGNGQDIYAMGFLWDGRVCCMVYEEHEHVFRYVPAEE